MLDIIFAIKFVHLLAAAVMLGTWFCVAGFMLLAHHSGNTSVVALTSQFVVRIELVAMAAALALQPVSGFLLAWAIGLSPLSEFWIIVSLVFYGLIVCAWLAAVRLEIRIRGLTREATLNASPLSPAYRKLFRAWTWLAGPILAAMVAVYALMIWQPRMD
jgi:uncharacterized membrane protein